jgi:FixJ family two-component response regulator
LQPIPIVSIVDDDDSVRTATGCLVRSLGYVAHTFASAEEFLQSPHVNETSCLIADVQMPNMSGIALQSVLRSQGLRTPIIFITAFPEERIRARALEGGAICFLSKPFDCGVLIDHLAAALAMSRDLDA